MLAQRGAKLLHGPTIRTMPVADADAARAATEELIARPPDCVVVNTGVGVRAWWALADGWGLTEELTNVVAAAYVVARGPKAAGVLMSFGIDTEWRSPASTLSDAVEHLLEKGVAGARIALQLDGSGRAVEARCALEGAGAEVVAVPTYRWTLPRDHAPALRLIEAVCAQKLDAVTFTAAPAVHNLFVLAEQEGVADPLRAALDGPVVAMCVGPVCREAMSERGVVHARQPRTARLGTMVKDLVDELEGRRRLVAVGGVEIEVQGALVRARGGSVLLTGRERDLFRALVRRPGAVLPRTALLAEMWGDPQTDGHALEVAVGRLRRKLAPTGLTIEAVTRRGYRLARGAG